jgi:hypothetical protein
MKAETITEVVKEIKNISKEKADEVQAFFNKCIESEKAGYIGHFILDDEDSVDFSMIGLMASYQWIDIEAGHASINITNDTLTFAEQTGYPNLFKDTYWGSFTGVCDWDILNKRHRFIESNDIVEHVKVSMQKNNGVFDHLEVYKTSQGLYILLFSPYHTHKMSISLIRSFKVIDPIYSKDALSMIAVFEDIKSLKKFVKEAK